MSKEFKIPELGEGVESATVASILVSEGDTVEKDQSVVELETDKAATEVPCDIAGTVEKIHIKEGDEISVGDTVITLEESGDSEAEDKEDQQEKPEPEDSDESPGEDKEETSDESDKSEESDQSPEKDESELSDESEESDETPDKIPGEEEEEKESEEKPDQQKEAKKKPAKEEAETEKEEETPETTEGETPVPAAPSVRRFAREVGVDLSNVEGSGEHGQISSSDVKSQAKSSVHGETASAELPDFSKWGTIKRRPMSKVRQLTAEQMVRSASIVPQATQFGKADITEMESLRDQYAAKAEEAGGHLSLTVILIKTVVGALNMFPQFNASIDPESKEIIYKEYFHIGIAIDTERGLMVPVIRDADKKSIIELAVELGELTERARDGKLKPEEMQGGCLSITNAGALGGDLFVPIVNWPEAAILGVAQTRTEPLFLNDTFEPRQMLPLSLSYDHRLIDGADGVRFMRWMTQALEDPVKLAWEG